MKKAMQILIILLLFISCEETENEKTLKAREFEDWIEMIIPNGREAFGIAGSISDTLLVSTRSGIYFSTDSGSHWQLSQDFHSEIYELVEHSDTIIPLFGLELELRDVNEPVYIEDAQYAVYSNYYTTDFGKTWKRDTLQLYKHIESPIGISESPTGVVCKIKNDKNWITPNSYRINFSDIEMYNQSSWQTIDFPLEYEITNLHIDENNYLYASTSSSKYIQENKITGPSTDYPAIIYFYKQILP